MSVFIFIIILSFLVIIHELGHFLVAKKKKVNVKEFGLGYPPRLKSLFKWRGTLFTLNTIPFGGFLRMEGEEGQVEETSTPQSKTQQEDQDKPKPFYLLSGLDRLQVILAGVVINFLFGVLAFSIIFSVSGIPATLNGQPRIGQISEGSPADLSSLPTNVNIVGFVVEAEQTKTEKIADVQKFVQEHRGQEVTMLLTGQCDGDSCGAETSETTIHLRTQDETPADQGSMGVVFVNSYFKFYPWYQMPWRGVIYGMKEALAMGGMMIAAVWSVFADLFKGNGLSAELAGPVGIVYYAQRSKLFQEGWMTLLGFSGMLSINLAIMNLLPIPALDGGRAFFILLEPVVGKLKIRKVEKYANYGGFLLLIGLIVTVTIRDVWRIVSGS